jgi:hypothetical protein
MNVPRALRCIMECCSNMEARSARTRSARSHALQLTRCPFCCTLCTALFYSGASRHRYDAARPYGKFFTRNASFLLMIGHDPFFPRTSAGWRTLEANLKKLASWDEDMTAAIYWTDIAKWPALMVGTSATFFSHSLRVMRTLAVTGPPYLITISQSHHDYHRGIQVFAVPPCRASGERSMQRCHQRRHTTCCRQLL